MDSISIVRHNNVKTLNRSIYKKSFEVKVFSKSEELSYLKRLVDKSRYNDSLVFEKLFFRFNNRPTNGGYYLKNKYLYLTTKGIISYLGAREEKQATELDDYIIKVIQGWLDKDKESKINIISLGAADSIEESKILAQFEAASLKRINYIPVDVSPMLIQLGINNFAANKSLSKLNVSSIVSDIWDLAYYIEDSKNDAVKSERRKEFFGAGKRLFLLLGSTFGSYPESDFLKQIVELMDDKDTLLIGYQKVGDKFSDSALYSDPDFLLAPLTYIPYFYGYSQYPGSFLKTSDSLQHNGDISDIPNSKSIARYICSERKPRDNKESKIYLTWNTQYESDDLVTWLHERFTETEGDQVDRGRRSGSKYYFLPTCSIEENLDGIPGGLILLGRIGCDLVDGTMEVGIVMLRHVHPLVYHRRGTLDGGRVVQIDKRLAVYRARKGREQLPEFFYIHFQHIFRGVCKFEKLIFLLTLISYKFAQYITFPHHDRLHLRYYSRTLPYPGRRGQSRHGLRT